MDIVHFLKVERIKCMIWNKSMIEPLTQEEMDEINDGLDELTDMIRILS